MKSLFLPGLSVSIYFKLQSIFLQNFSSKKVFISQKFFYDGKCNAIQVLINRLLIASLSTLEAVVRMLHLFL